jgi:hypothetical protein
LKKHPHQRRGSKSRSPHHAKKAPKKSRSRSRDVKKASRIKKSSTTKSVSPSASVSEHESQHDGPHSHDQHDEHEHEREHEHEPLDGKLDHEIAKHKDAITSLVNILASHAKPIFDKRRVAKESDTRPPPAPLPASMQVTGCAPKSKHKASSPKQTEKPHRLPPMPPVAPFRSAADRRQPDPPPPPKNSKIQDDGRHHDLVESPHDEEPPWNQAPSSKMGWLPQKPPPAAANPMTSAVPKGMPHQQPRSPVWWTAPDSSWDAPDAAHATGAATDATPNASSASQSPRNHSYWVSGHYHDDYDGQIWVPGHWVYGW